MTMRMFGWVGDESVDRSDTAMGRILRWALALLVLVVVGGILALGSGIKSAFAEGKAFEVGTDRTVTWEPVTTRRDGRPVKGDVTYHVYAGSSAADMTLIVEGVTGTSASGVPTLEGQNYVGIVTEEAGNTAGPSPMSALFPFEGVVPDSPPNQTRVLSVE